MQKNNNLDILFLTKLYPKDQESEIRSKMRVDMQDAANALQWNLVEGIEENIGGSSIKILNYLPIDSFPKHYKDCFVKSYNFTLGKGVKAINVDFCNLTGFKQIFTVYKFLPHIKKWANNGDNRQKVIICYTLDNMFLQLIKYAKKFIPSIVACVVVPDLPVHIGATNLKGLRGLYKNYSLNNNKKLIKHIDCFVLLTKHMAEFLNIDKPFAVIEGIAPENHTKKQKSSGKELLYTGSLNKKYGILTLLQAFSSTKDKDFRLIICGLGDAEEDVKEYAKKDCRITFKGKVERDKVLDMQTQVKVLINPRQNIEEFTKYSFPSKNLEYLSSGTPLIAYKLDGIPDDYDDLIYYVKDNSIECLTEKIEEVLSASDESLIEWGERTKKFVTENKNKKVQTGKIVDLINNIKH